MRWCQGKPGPPGRLSYEMAIPCDYAGRMDGVTQRQARKPGMKVYKKHKRVVVIMK